MGAWVPSLIGELNPISRVLLFSHSVMSESSATTWTQPARLLCQWDFLGKNTGVAISSSRDSSQPRNWTQAACIAGRFFNIWTTRKALKWWHLPKDSERCPLGGTVVKIHLSMEETLEMCVQSLVQEDPQRKEMAPHSTILAWKTQWTEEPGRLRSMGSTAEQPNNNDTVINVGTSNQNWRVWISEYFKHKQF